MVKGTAHINHTRLLRDVVEQRLNKRWPEFAAAHPHLAEAIDRTRLVESAVARLREDAQFQAALREAELDVSKLAAAARALERAEGLVGRVLGI